MVKCPTDDIFETFELPDNQGPCRPRLEAEHYRKRASPGDENTHDKRTTHRDDTDLLVN